MEIRDFNFKTFAENDIDIALGVIIITPNKIVRTWTDSNEINNHYRIIENIYKNIYDNYENYNTIKDLFTYPNIIIKLAKFSFDKSISVVIRFPEKITKSQINSLNKINKELLDYYGTKYYVISEDGNNSYIHNDFSFFIKKYQNNVVEDRKIKKVKQNGKSI